MSETERNIRSVLVIGGARSGKSRFAQTLAEASGLDLLYVATAEARDGEMTDRIEAHAAARGPSWRLVEAPVELAAALSDEAAASRILLVDCVTLWLSNRMLRDDDVEHATRELVHAVSGLSGPAIIVTNEVGQGIVPDNALTRRFRDAQGRLNQALAQACDGVVLVTAGLPHCLKPAGTINFKL